VSALVIVNPVAGNGRGRRLVHEHRSLLASADVVQTNGPGHATVLARAAAAEGRERVVVVGGDGTVFEVVNGLLAAPGPMLGVVAGGSGNDLSRSVGLPLSPADALRVALTGKPRVIDLARATAGDGSIAAYASAAGAGFDGQVAAAMHGPRPAWQRSRLGYVVATLFELRRFRNRRLEVVVDGGSAQEATVLLTAITNGPYYGGGMKICPAARVDDGMLDVCLVGDISRFETLKQLPGLYDGRHVTHPAVRFLRVRWIELRELDGTEGTQTHLDGEPFGPLPLRIEVLPGALGIAYSARAS
jgi:diacylglycerol kinase (ATP)